jgi:molybdenum cofactor cytidylyltransferase
MQGILLAAGFGLRFDAAGGRDKLLQPLGDGRPLLWHSARALCTALPHSLAVIRPANPERMHWLRAAGCTVVESAAAASGIGSALAHAVRASADAPGWVVALADMPWLQAETIAAVAALIDAPQALAAPVCQGRRGHPVAFGTAWRGRLSALSGDAGARELLRDAEIRLLDTDDQGVLRDVDTPADLTP